MGLGSMFKGAMVEMAAKQWIMSRTRAVRDVRRLKIDSAGKAAEVELEVVGEPEPVSVHVGRYEIIDEGGQCFLQIHELTSSKEWLSILASEHLFSRRIPIPSSIRNFL
jgi:hypothetical protein